jgi:DNA-binding response OmpR family regulator
MQKILVIDDDECIRDTIGVMLERESYIPLYAGDGKSGYEKALALRPNLLLVDLRLPTMSGLDVCRQLRKANVQTPIIVLSAIADEIEKVLLLEIGADDYMVKPFGSRELLARIRAVLRRNEGDTYKILSFSDTEIDLERRSVLRRGAEVKLTPTEYNLLAFFLQNADSVLTREVILNSVWGRESYPSTRTVDVHVMRLRHKFELEAGAPCHFLTVHGVGYRFLP